MLQKYCTSTAFLNEDHENGTNRRDGSTEAPEQSCKAPGADALDRGEDRRGRTARRHSSMATRGRTRTDRAHLSELLVSLQEDAAGGRTGRKRTFAGAGCSDSEAAIRQSTTAHLQLRPERESGPSQMS